MSFNTATVLVLGLAAALLALGLYFYLYRYRLPRDRSAPHRLGQEMGLDLLAAGDRRNPAWYGGRYKDHEIAQTYVNLRYGNYGPRRALSVEDVVLSLRLAVALNVDSAPDIVAYFRHGRPFQPGVEPEDFEHAFDRRNTEWLSQEARDALLAFAQTYGSLRLRPRQGGPQGLLADEALPDAQMVLVHDRPGYQQTPEEVRALYDALLDVAAVLEDSAASGQ